MLRFLCFFLIISASVWLTHGAPRVSSIDMAWDLSRILQSRVIIESLSGTGRTYTAFTRAYLQDLGAFAAKYAAPFRVFALRPTIDRSLAYRLYIQDYALSCEITALRIILDRLGIIVSERDIFASIPQFPFVYGSGGIWWDPEIEFVGYYTGAQTQQTGYGVYEAPIAQYAQSYSLHTRIINQSSYSRWSTRITHMWELLSTLDDPRSHVILWGDWCTDPASEDGFFPKWGKSILRSFPLPARNRCYRSASERILRWQTPSGKQVVWLSGEHAFVLLGYIGKKEKPTHIIVWDTYTGRHVYPYAEWMRKWSELQYRSLIISQ